MPTCWIIAGPNGAGKTTFALEYLPTVAGCSNFINADLIAAGLSPLDPNTQLVAAGRMLLREIDERIEAGEDFAFETTLSGRGYLRLAARLKKLGWRVELIYLALPSVEMSALRVAERVAKGGHDVPPDAIGRRFGRSLGNLLEHYAQAVDYTLCLMNDTQPAAHVFEQDSQGRLILNPTAYEALIKTSRQ